MLAENTGRRGHSYWHGADLVVEVVSQDDPNQDLDTKREEYAQAGIREYWIADPRDVTITVLTLAQPGQPYTVAGQYGRGSQSQSVLLTGLSMDVEQVFSQV